MSAALRPQLASLVDWSAGCGVPTARAGTEAPLVVRRMPRAHLARQSLILTHIQHVLACDGRRRGGAGELRTGVLVACETQRNLVETVALGLLRVLPGVCGRPARWALAPSPWPY